VFTCGRAGLHQAASRPRGLLTAEAFGAASRHCLISNLVRINTCVLQAASPGRDTQLTAIAA